MRLTSHYGSKIFWRTFKTNDKDHWFGLHEGFMDFNQTDDINENGSSFQLEIKEGGLFGKILTPAHPSVQYNNHSIRIVDSSGKVVESDGSDSRTIGARATIDFRYTFGGDVKRDYLALDSRLIFAQGENGHLLVTGEQLTIPDFISIFVKNISGWLDPADGSMALNATLSASANQKSISLSTGGTRSRNGKFVDTGTPFDTGSRKVKLVCGDGLDSPIQTEFLLAVTYELESNPF